MKVRLSKPILLLFLIGSVISCSFIAKQWEDFGIMKAFEGHSLDPAYFNSSCIKEETARKRKQHEIDQMIKLLPSVIPEKFND